MEPSGSVMSFSLLREPTPGCWSVQGVEVGVGGQGCLTACLSWGNLWLRQARLQLCTELAACLRPSRWEDAAGGGYPR